MLTSHEKQIYKLPKNVVLNPKDGVLKKQMMNPKKTKRSSQLQSFKHVKANRQFIAGGNKHSCSKESICAILPKITLLFANGTQ